MMHKFFSYLAASWAAPQHLLRSIYTSSRAALNNSATQHEKLHAIYRYLITAAA